MILFMLAAEALLFLSLVVVFEVRHIDIRLLARLLGKPVAFALIWSLVCTWLVTNWFPVAVSAEGIYGHSFLCRQRFVAWRDVSEVRTFRLANLRWLRIYAASRRKVTWLALFQSQGAEFRYEIQRLAPEDSPVLKHLQ